MNPVFKILNRIAAGLDSLIDGMDKQTMDTVRQAGYLLAFLLVAASIGFGIHLGTKNARIGTAPLFTATNEIFEISVKRSRETPYSSTMVESDSINEISDPELRRILFPSKAGQEPEASETIVEPETGKAERPAESAGPDRLAEIDRTDGKPGKADVRSLEKKESSSVSDTPGVIESKETNEGVVLKSPARTDTADQGSNGEDSPSTLKPLRVHGKKNPNPLDRGGEVIDR
jgi:hypothetical protein